MESNKRRKNIPVVSFAPVERIIRHAGAARVSRSASEELARVGSEVMFDIAEQANEFAKHAGRTTVKREDIALAVTSISKKK